MGNENPDYVLEVVHFPEVHYDAVVPLDQDPWRGSFYFRVFRGFFLLSASEEYYDPDPIMAEESYDPDPIMAEEQPGRGSV